MGRLLPCPLGRPQNLITTPQVGHGLPCAKPGFTSGDPRPWVPGTLAALRAAGTEALPWGGDCDLLLAPYPAPGREASALMEMLEELPDGTPVARDERATPIVPNLLIAGPGGEVRRADGGFADPGAGLRAYRTAFRHRGLGGAEALVLMPAARVRALLRGSHVAEKQPRGGDSLLNRRFLVAALDHQRSLAVLADLAADPRELDPVERVVVVMPHFDDEVLQCGAALLAAREAGAEVRAIWLTDGARGIEGAAPEESARVRHREGRAALAELGVEDLHFLDAPETFLRRRGPWTRRLRRLLQEFAPQRVHSVWWGDNHVDHYEAFRVLRAAWPRGLQDCEIAASGAWTPVPGGRVVTIDPVRRAVKDRALAAHASQLAQVDYRRVERGLARWYGRDLVDPGEAERFLCAPAPELFAAYRASGADKRVFVGGGAARAATG